MHRSVVQVLVLALVLLVGAGTVAVGESQPKYGGTLRVAIASNPSALDPQVVTADETCMIAQHILEPLYAIDNNMATQPFLVESDEYNADGTVLTLHLRHAVLFHNGEEMDSGDVVASVQRWLAYGVRGANVKSYVTDVKAIDQYTVAITTSGPVSTMKDLMAAGTGGCFIMPEEIAGTVGKTPITEAQCIGTGPYKLAEKVAGQYVRIIRFDRYTPDNREPSGFCGTRTAYFDAIEFITVPEAATRLAGVKAGDYDYAYSMSSDLYNTLAVDPDLAVRKPSPPGFLVIARNHHDGVMSNDLLYEAMCAALDCDEVMMLAAGPLGRAEGSILGPETPWYSQVGTERYNQADPDKARLLMEQAGYKKEPITFLTSATYDYIYNASLAVASQLTAVGFNINLQLYDWATFVSLRDNTDNWDLLFASHGGLVEPSLLSYLSPTKYWRWDSDEIAQLKNAFYAALDFDERFVIWEQIQRLCYDEGIVIKLGDRFDYHIASAERLGGLEEVRAFTRPFYWNLWLK